MKKTISLFCALCLCMAIFTGCANKAQDNSNNAAVPNDTEPAVAENVSDPADTTDDSLRTYEFTPMHFVEYVDDKLSESGFNRIITDDIDIQKTTMDKYGEINCYTFPWASAGYLFLYADIATDLTIKIALAVDIDMLSDQDIDEYSLLSNLILGMMEKSDAKRIRSELNLNNLTDDGVTHSTGKITEYTYSVNDNTIMLILTASSQLFEKDDSTTEPENTVEDTLKIEIKDGRFLITAEQVVAEMDKRLEKGGYPKISDCKMTADSGTMAGFGDVTTQTYDLGEGVQLILYSDVDGNLIQVFYYVVPSKLTDEGSLYGFCCGLNFTMFAPDVDFGTLIDKLDIKNLTENTITSAHSEKSSFTYIVNGDSVMLSIMAN